MANRRSCKHYRGDGELSLSAGRFVSYASHQEDVLLWRAFREVGTGFFIDVGAEGTQDGSVTQAFYEKGWRGVNIQPLPAGIEMLQVLRPEDTNLPLAIADVAERWEPLDTNIAVATVSLDAVCAKYVTDTIHFLRVGVVHAQQSLLASLNLQRFRPQIILVSVTADEAQGDVPPRWDALLTGNRYVFTWCDGFNRFYVAEECANLKAAFYAPPNARDAFITHYEQLQQAHIARLQEHLQTEQNRVLALLDGSDFNRLHHEIAESQRRVHQLENQCRELKQHHAAALAAALLEKKQAVIEAKQALINTEQALLEKARIFQELQTVYSGTVWRVTKPLRWLADQVKWLIAWRVRLLPQTKSVLMKLLRYGKGLLMRYPQTGKYTAMLLERNPRLRRQLRRLAGLGVGVGVLPLPSGEDGVTVMPNLGRSAAGIYLKLQTSTLSSTEVK